LLEKASCSTAAEAEILFRSALCKQVEGPVLLEALHSRFQPAWVYFLSLIDPAQVEHVKTVTRFPAAMFSKDDIRWKYELGGGAMMVSLSGFSVIRTTHTE